MSEDWFDRFRTAIKRDGRSMREISLAAGRGVNYVQQCLKDGKEMSANKLMGLLDVLGSGSALYVLTGAEMSQQDEEFFKMVLALDPELRAAAADLFRKLPVREGAPVPQPSPRLSD